MYLILLICIEFSETSRADLMTFCSHGSEHLKFMRIPLIMATFAKLVPPTQPTALLRTSSLSRVHQQWTQQQGAVLAKWKLYSRVEFIDIYTPSSGPSLSFLNFNECIPLRGGHRCGKSPFCSSRIFTKSILYIFIGLRYALSFTFGTNLPI